MGVCIRRYVHGRSTRRPHCLRIGYAHPIASITNSTSVLTPPREDVRARAQGTGHLEAREIAVQLPVEAWQLLPAGKGALGLRW